MENLKILSAKPYISFPSVTLIFGLVLKFIFVSKTMSYLRVFRVLQVKDIERISWWKHIRNGKTVPVENFRGTEIFSLFLLHCVVFNECCLVTLCFRDKKQSITFMFTFLSCFASWKSDKKVSAGDTAVKKWKINCPETGRKI